MLSCDCAAGRPAVCWAWRTPVLPGAGRAALRVPSAPLPPEEGLPHPVLPPPAALPDTTWMSSSAPPQLPLVGIPAAPPLPLFPSRGSKKSPRRSQRRLRQVPPLPARAGNAPLGGHGDPPRGGLAALRPLHHPTRGHPTSNTRRTPQQLLKPGLGHQLGHAPAPKKIRRCSLVI